jgi:hypothetical protein
LRRKPLSTATAIFCLALASGVFMLLASIRHGRDSEAAGDGETIEAVIPAAIEEDVREARRLLVSDPDAALRHIERALRRAAAAGPDLRAELYTWAAAVHARRWHWHRARDALSSAIELAPTDTRRRSLADVEESIRRAQGERDLAQRYRAARNTGPAAALRGRIVVAYVFVDPSGPRRWTDVDRLYARNTLARVERWYAAKAVARRVAAPEFVDRVFEVPLAAGDLPVFPNVDRARRTAWELVANLGHDSVRQWLATLAAEERADHVMLVVHSPQDARSFAAICTRRGSCDGEAAFIYIPTGPNAWDALAFTLAHEGLHLFGANDLYNVHGAEDYAATDVMHYPSARLEYADVGDLTAWAVGLASDRPTTPFPVEE